MSPIVILSATRTALGSFQGGLAGVPAPKLGAAAIKGAVALAGLAPEDISDVLMGNVLQAGLGQAPARQAALQAGLSPSTRCVTIHKVCGSGMEAVIHGSRLLALGEGTFVAAGGMENMSSAPYLLLKAREGYRLGHQQVIDSVVRDGLWDPYNDIHMGSCAEKCAMKFAFTRKEQDAYAAESFRRANAAQSDGRFSREITPVEVVDSKRNATWISSDEGPGKVKYDKIPTLRPFFEKNGTITAANASTLNDGAAALILARSETVACGNLKPVARIVSHANHAQDPLWFTTAPIEAARKALAMAGWNACDVDLWEVNEAFAVVPLAMAKELQIPADKLNVHGGAIALGHPIGASGARILVTLLAALRERKAQRGVAAICIGGGEGLALCVELL